VKPAAGIYLLIDGVYLLICRSGDALALIR
jgi:hypothetical protein